MFRFVKLIRDFNYFRSCGAFAIVLFGIVMREVGAVRVQLMGQFNMSLDMVKVLV